jgi:hypothetical protein
MEQFRNIENLIEITCQSKIHVVDTVHITDIDRCLSCLDPLQQRLVLNQDSLPLCRQLLQGLSNLFYAFSRLASVCLSHGDNQQTAHFQTRVTLVHQ